MPVIAPAGLSPAGLFVAQTFVDPTKPAGILADARDPLTGELLSIGKGMDPIDSQVITALSLKQGSGAAVMDEGETFAEIKKIDDSTVSLIESRTRLALKRLLDNGDIEIVALQAAANYADQSGGVGLQYRNLRARGAQARSLVIIP